MKRFTYLPNLVILNGTLAKKIESLTYLVFPPHWFPNIMILKKFKN